MALTGDIASQISRIKAEEGPLLQVRGSWRLIQLLLVHDLIDEYRLWTFPVLVGDGKRVFAKGLQPQTIALQKPDRLPMESSWASIALPLRSPSQKGKALPQAGKGQSHNGGP